MTCVPTASADIVSRTDDLEAAIETLKREIVKARTEQKTGEVSLVLTLNNGGISSKRLTNSWKLK